RTVVLRRTAPTELARQAKKFRRSPVVDPLTLLLGQIGLGLDVGDRRRRLHIEGEVAAEHDPVCADRAYEEVAGESGMNDRVEIEMPKIGAGRPVDMLAAFGPCVETGIEPADDEGQEAARLPKAQTQPRETIQQARKNELCRRER